MTLNRKWMAHWRGGAGGFLSLEVPVALALFLICVVTLTGCRENAGVTAPDSETRIVLDFTAGDTFVYDRWALDEFGYQITASKRQEYWRVLHTGINTRGETGVTVVIDSVDVQHVDTLLIRSNADGDICQFGFLARLVNQMGGRTIVPQWDLLLRSGRTSPTTWAVGVADSIAADTVYAQGVAAPDYFSVQLNGRSNVFPAYRVELNGMSLQLAFWVTGAPSCFPGFREESTVLGNGFETYLSSAVVAHG
jgi:hypothetical protein